MLTQKSSSSLATPPAAVIDDFLQLISGAVEGECKIGSINSFTRNRRLPLLKLITFILSIASSGKTQSVDGKIGKFIGQARAKLSCTLFESPLSDSVNLLPTASGLTHLSPLGIAVQSLVSAVRNISCLQ